MATPALGLVPVHAPRRSATSCATTSARRCTPPAWAHVKIVIWDHNRDLMVERASVVYADPEAAQFVWGTGFHWYGADHFDHVQQVHDAWPDKQLLFTEGCQEGGPHTGSWELGERYARSIINDLNRWTVGWIDWNLLLDERGGPNHVRQLLQRARCWPTPRAAS